LFFFKFNLYRYNPGSLIVMALVEGHPTLNENAAVKTMLTCVPPTPLGAAAAAGSAISGMGSIGVAAPVVGGFGRRLLQFQPLAHREIRPGMCICMPPATLDCGGGCTQAKSS
jgi:hypothetical protein